MGPIYDFEVKRPDGSSYAIKTDYPVTAVIRCPQCKEPVGFLFDSPEVTVTDIRFTREGQSLGQFGVSKARDEAQDPLSACDVCSHLFKLSDAIREEV